MRGSTSRPEGPWQSPPLKSNPFVTCAGQAHSQVGSCRDLGSTRLGSGHTCMTLSDTDLTCAPRREGLRRVRRRVTLPIIHTYGTHAYTHIQHMHTHPHTCMHTVLMCTHFHSCAQTHITKSRSGKWRAEQRFGRKTELMELVETWISVAQGRERGPRAWRAAARDELKLGGCRAPSEPIFCLCVPVS